MITRSDYSASLAILIDGRPPRKRRFGIEVIQNGTNRDIRMPQSPWLMLLQLCAARLLNGTGLVSAPESEKRCTEMQISRLRAALTNALDGEFDPCQLICTAGKWSYFLDRRCNVHIDPSIVELEPFIPRRRLEILVMLANRGEAV